MKKALILLGLGVLLANVQAAPPAKPSAPGLASSNGADLIKGTWNGKLCLNGVPRQINLYFNATAQEGPENPGCFKASGYFSHDDAGGQKRAKTPALPMMARFVKSTDGKSYDVVILATVQIPSDSDLETTVVRLAGKAVLGGSAVTDDGLGGEWSALGYNGTWSARHLDRRNVNAPAVDLTDPTLWFCADVYGGLEGPLGGQVPATCWGCISNNIVMAQVQVACPDGSTIIVPPSTDALSPGIDRVTTFNFTRWQPGLPVVGGRYIFTGLDVAGHPIPGVVATDTWGNADPPEPPTNVSASVVDSEDQGTGIMVEWDAVPVVPDSFVPDADPPIGYYQLELCELLDPSGLSRMVYMGVLIETPSHLIPQHSDDLLDGQDYGAPIDDLPDGVYSLRTSIVSMTPADSVGFGIEYHNADSTTQALWIMIVNHSATVLPHQGSWQPQWWPY